MGLLDECEEQARLALEESMLVMPEGPSASAPAAAPAPAADAVPAQKNAAPEVAEKAPRRSLPIFKQDLEIFGYTKGLPKLQDYSK